MEHDYQPSNTPFDVAYCPICRQPLEPTGHSCELAAVLQPPEPSFVPAAPFVLVRPGWLDYVQLLAMVYCVAVHFNHVWPGMVFMGDGDPARGFGFMLEPFVEALVTIWAYGRVCLDMLTDCNGFGTPAFCITVWLIVEDLFLRSPNPLFVPESPWHVNAIERIMTLCVVLAGLIRRYGLPMSSRL